MLSVRAYRRRRRAESSPWWGKWWNSRRRKICLRRCGRTSTPADQALKKRLRHARCFLGEARDPRVRQTAKHQEASMQVLKSAALAFSLIALAASAYAAGDTAKQKSGSTQSPSMSQNQPSSFESLDKNHDGQISRAEWDAGQKSGA